LIRQNCHTRQPWDRFLEEFELLPGLARVEGGDPRNISPRALYTGDYPICNWIDHYREDNRDARGDVLGSPRRYGADHTDDVYPKTGQVGSKFREPLGPPFGEPGFNDDSAALRITNVVESLSERLEKRRRCGWSRCRGRRQEPNPRDLGRRRRLSGRLEIQGTPHSREDMKSANLPLHVTCSNPFLVTRGPFL